MHFFFFFFLPHFRGGNYLHFINIEQQTSVAFQNPQRALRNEACKTCLPDVLSAVKQKEQSEHINKAIVKPILKDFTIDSINTHNLLESAQQKSRRLQFSVNAVL